MEKKFYINSKVTKVKLVKEHYTYRVYIGDVVWYEGANELFAIQRFNEV